MQILRILHHYVITNLDCSATDHPAERNADAYVALVTRQRALREAPFSRFSHLKDDRTDDKSQAWSKPSGVQSFNKQVLAKPRVAYALLTQAFVNCPTGGGVKENHLTVAGPAVRVSYNAPFSAEVGASNRNAPGSPGGGSLDPCERGGHASLYHFSDFC